MPIIHQAIAVEDLPPPPGGKTGWPWMEASDPLPEKMPDGSEWPRISVVTPSYNQGQFIEETIRSVLLQSYPNLEYIIIDGGSSDNSVEIIKKYEPWLAYWVSEKDRGQSHALNKGFRRATGKLIGWQNSDDYYELNGIYYLVAEHFSWSKPEVIYGDINVVDNSSTLLDRWMFPEFDANKMLPYLGMNNQGMLISRFVFEQGYCINENYQHCMDFDFFWRLILSGNVEFRHIPKIVGNFRFHDQAKGIKQTDVASDEFWLIYSDLYSSQKVSSKIKDQALSAMINISRQYFANLNFKKFRQSFVDTYRVTGFSGIPFELYLKFILSSFGRRLVKGLKYAKNHLIIQHQRK